MDKKVPDKNMEQMGVNRMLFSSRDFSAPLRENWLRSYTATIYITRTFSGLQSQAFRLPEFHDATNEVLLYFGKVVANT